jgi:hypothetical protein
MGQNYALLWPFMLCHLGLSATRRGYCPNGVNSISMADTKTAAYNGGILVPHECLSDAKIRRIPETSKHFPKFNIKQREASIKSRLSYVLSYYNNYMRL